MECNGDGARGNGERARQTREYHLHLHEKQENQSRREAWSKKASQDVRAGMEPEGSLHQVHGTSVLYQVRKRTFPFSKGLCQASSVFHWRFHHEAVLVHMFESMATETHDIEAERQSFDVVLSKGNFEHVAMKM